MDVATGHAETAGMPAEPSWPEVAGGYAYARMPPLDHAALTYLAVPLAIFFAGFVIWVIAVPALVVIAATLFRLRPRLSRPPGSLISRADLYRALGTAVLALLFLWACAYLPPFGKTWDWVKHYALINELTRFTWPPVNDETHTYLRYSLAYYLFPALFARLFGERQIDAAVFLETFAGLWLILMLLVAKVRPARPWAFLTIFLLFGGLDLVGWLLTGRQSPLLATKEWWVEHNYLFAYESHSTLFLWVPQHALPGLLGILLLLPTEGRKASTASLGLLGAAALFWSPFAALGLFPFALSVASGDLRKTILDPGNILCALVLVLPLVVYLHPGADRIPHEFSWDRPGFSILVYVEFVLLEVGLFLIALAYSGGFRHLRHPAVVIAVLLALPLYRVGLYNDFTMRTCIPAIGLLAIAVAAALTETKSLRVLPLAALVVIGAGGAVLEIAVNARGYRLPPSPQTLREGFLHDDQRFFVQYNAPLPNWILR